MNEIQKINHQTLMNLPGPSPKASLALTLAKSGSCEVSVFAGGQASVAQIATSVRKLSTAFPQMSAEFFNLLTERITKTGMTAQRLDFAINRVIDNFTYKQLTIADVLNVDVKCRILSYAQMCDETSKRGASTDEYAPVYIGDADRPGWVLKVDKMRYNIPDRL